MLNKIIKFLALGGVVWLCSRYFDGISVVDFTHAVLAAFILAVVNTLLQPIATHRPLFPHGALLASAWVLGQTGLA